MPYLEHQVAAIEWFNQRAKQGDRSVFSLPDGGVLKVSGAFSGADGITLVGQVQPTPSPERCGPGIIQ